MKGYFFYSVLKTIFGYEFIDGFTGWLFSVVIEAAIIALIVALIASILFDKEFGDYFKITFLIVVGIEIFLLFI